MEKDVSPNGPRSGRSLLPNAGNSPQMDNRIWPAVLLQFPYAPFPPSPYWPGPVASPWSTGASNSHPSPGSVWTSGQPGSSRTQGQEVEAENGDEDDVIDLLDDTEALKFIQFDPSVQDENVREAGEVINTFLEKHFLHPLAPEEREAIKKDFPNPASSALAVPKLDDEIKEQIKKAGKNAHFGAERSLFKLQEQILEMAGPLTCS